ncbi:hypothetical protein SNK03_012740 [Fusarium graminearum]
MEMEVMEALEASTADPLPPASDLSTAPPAATTVKDPTSTKTTHQPRSRSGSGLVAAPTAIVTALRKRENTSPSFSTPTKWPSVRSTTTAARMPASTTTAAKPLVPLSERRIHQTKHTPRSLKDSDSSADNQGSLARWEIAPDGGSAGREGRQFTVANVGNNGRIYLRPTVRPAYQRCPQPQFVFPITPPSTAGLDAIYQNKQVQDETSELHVSQWTPTEPSPYDTNNRTYFEHDSYPLRPVRHRRALSDSTVHEATVAKDSEPGAFKIVISKPLEEYRPRTMEDLDSNDPLLDISIPSWRIGVPRFTGRGTPMIRGSSYAPTEEFRSSSASLLSRPQGVLNSSHPDIASPRRPNSMVVPMLRLSRTMSALTQTPSSAQFSKPVRPSWRSNSKVEPAMFDELTFKPACDDRTLVKYSAATGAVVAATPPRLVAEITSPSFLDYELISDFFLTFRAFLEPVDLCRMLIARLRWALARDDETGMVVRVRTFVALRHWILNYFMDDFVVDYNLRLVFCELLNDFVDELSQCNRGRKVQLKILGELKKCWRRVCALYWDSPDFDDTLDSSVPVTPGGIAGHRDASLDPSFWEQDGAETPRIESLLPVRKSLAERTSFIADISRAGRVRDSVVVEPRPSTPDGQLTRDPMEGQQASPVSMISMASMDIVSCSFPTKIKPTAQPAAQNHQTNPLAAHPVTATSNPHSGPVATTPRALVGKRVRPQGAHKRNNSLTDSLREHSTDKLSFKDQEFMMTAPYAGSLVRGNLLPPGQAYVDIDMQEFSNGLLPMTSISQESQSLIKQRTPGSAMSGHGMKKLLGSVRRALSTRGQGTSSTQGSFVSINNIGPRGATTNRIPGTAVVPQNRQRPSCPRPPVRIDLLGAEVVEDFKKAVRDEAAAEANRRGLPPPMSPSTSLTPARDIQCSAAVYMDPNDFEQLPHEYRHRPTSDMAITTGSKSIVIVDDTTPFDPSLLHRIPTSNASVEAFADAFKLTGADPTPPSTPPAGHSTGTPRRSSYLLNQHLVRPSLDEDPLPPFVPDFATLAPVTSAPISEDGNRVSYSYTARSSRNHPPVSLQNHRRLKSGKTHRSLNSLLRRRSSATNALVRRSAVQSFDATTVSAPSVADPEPEEPMPKPLRILRRRPGGDLRAATNVGELDPVNTLRRSHSVGSLTTYSESIRSSFIQSPRMNSFGHGSFGRGSYTRGSYGTGEVVSIDYTQHKSEAFSVGQLADKPRRDLSLFSTHSSKPAMRPSFEKEAQKLAQIPDDDDDGGIESALAKLEGKFPERRAHKSAVGPPPLSRAVSDSVATHLLDVEHRKEHHEQQVVVRETFMFDAEDSEPEPMMESQDQHLTPQRPVTEAMSFLTGSSHNSYSSVPILERDSVKGRPWTNISVLEGPDEETTPRAHKTLPYVGGEGDPQFASYDFVEKTKSIEGIKPGDTSPSVEEDQSFLEDDSDLSSEMSADAIEYEESDFGESVVPRVKLPAHPLGSPAPPPNRKPPSPPMTLVQALEMSPTSCVHVPSLHEEQVWGQKPLPPTPETTPTAPYVVVAERATIDGYRQAAKPESIESNKYSAHLPFILAFDSEILAQQFTLIEKDALNEIDWKELIDMNWKDAAHSDSRSWVDFLRNSDAHGVEVVIARFNIMVKWAISEIVLTQGLEERVRCLTKFIHIATHCRRYRNFATLGQLTIALSSNEVARLTETWRHVPPQDLKTLQDLEQLVTPMRNFYNLRAEMETGSDQGCIPFVGIYTHDLLYNAQRPSEMAGSPTTPPLINFERCRIAASVVKTLLRLLEASTRYKFHPIEGITERCLWMSALSDEEIRRHSEMLE